MYGREHRAMRTAERERLGERGARRFREIDCGDNARELIHVVLPTGSMWFDEILRYPLEGKNGTSEAAGP